MPGDRADWLGQCVQSCINSGASVHVLAGIPDRLGEARSRGYSIGCAPFVTKCDPDDYVIDYAIQRCALALSQDDRLSLVSIGERVETINDDDSTMIVRHYPHARHGLIVYRRSAVSGCLGELQNHDHSADAFIVAEAMRRGGALHIDDVGIAIRIHKNNYHYRSSYSQHELRSIRRLS